MDAIHTNCDPAVLMVVEPRHMARRVDGSPRESNIGSQVRRRRALETACLTPTSSLDGPMDPAPTEPVGASDTTVSASAGGRLGYNWERFSNQALFSPVTFENPTKPSQSTNPESKNTIGPSNTPSKMDAPYSQKREEKLLTTNY